MFHNHITLSEFAELHAEAENIQLHAGSPAFTTGKHEDLGAFTFVQDPFKSEGLLISESDLPRFLEDGES